MLPMTTAAQKPQPRDEDLYLLLSEIQRLGRMDPTLARIVLDFATSNSRFEILNARGLVIQAIAVKLAGM